VTASKGLTDEDKKCCDGGPDDDLDEPSGHGAGAGAVDLRRVDAALEEETIARVIASRHSSHVRENIQRPLKPVCETKKWLLLACCCC
jgi:hypothetical protein